MSEEGVIAVIVTTVVVLLALVLITPLFRQTEPDTNDVVFCLILRSYSECSKTRAQQYCSPTPTGSQNLC